MLHHLVGADKRQAFAEVHRVLRPDGELHILDFGKPHSIPAYLISLVMRHAEQARENIHGACRRCCARQVSLTARKPAVE
jgi:ubiquinone/menaquinone biosynthesis C-methylase UbiE